MTGLAPSACCAVHIMSGRFARQHAHAKPTPAICGSADPRLLLAQTAIRPRVLPLCRDLPGPALRPKVRLLVRWAAGGANHRRLSQTAPAGFACCPVHAASLVLLALLGLLAMHAHMLPASIACKS